MPVEMGMVVEDAQTGYVGAVVRIEYGRMELEDARGRRKPFPVGPGYLIDGKPVILTAPRRAATTAAMRTASGSVAVPGAKVKVALSSRIYVEGRHDAELGGFGRHSEGSRHHGTDSWHEVQAARREVRASVTGHTRRSTDR